MITRVSEAFTGGGSQVGFSSNRDDRFELQNFTSWSAGAHSLKAGIRIRRVSIDDVSPQNFSGTFTFSGGLAPQLDANNQIVNDPVTGLPVLVQITSIERYRRTLLLKDRGFPRPRYGCVVEARRSFPLPVETRKQQCRKSITAHSFRTTGGFVLISR